MTWTLAETSTHQDHVIAHVIGATPVSHFIWDETAYLVLDIGFIWNIFLDMQMGLSPQAVALAELNADGLRIQELEDLGPIQSIDLLESGEERRLVLNCEDGNLVVETNIGHRSIRIITDESVA